MFTTKLGRGTLYKELPQKLIMHVKLALIKSDIFFLMVVVGLDCVPLNVGYKPRDTHSSHKISPQLKLSLLL